ncbi:unnamed protein product [Calicophoron daubneyi]|uniref:Uncharacterized protein n=1 Tax=Calicophoron daubneyi TaxID=300641 RepID=A0AAV2TZM1_CALDB
MSGISPQTEMSILLVFILLCLRISYRVTAYSIVQYIGLPPTADGVQPLCLPTIATTLPNVLQTGQVRSGLPPNVATPALNNLQLPASLPLAISQNLGQPQVETTVISDSTTGIENTNAGLPNLNLNAGKSQVDFSEGLMGQPRLDLENPITDPANGGILGGLLPLYSSGMNLLGNMAGSLRAAGPIAAIGNEQILCPEICGLTIPACPCGSGVGATVTTIPSGVCACSTGSHTQAPMKVGTRSSANGVQGASYTVTPTPVTTRSVTTTSPSITMKAVQMSLVPPVPPPVVTTIQSQPKPRYIVLPQIVHCLPPPWMHPCPTLVRESWSRRRNNRCVEGLTFAEFDRPCLECVPPPFPEPVCEPPRGFCFDRSDNDRWRVFRRRPRFRRPRMPPRMFED